MPQYEYECLDCSHKFVDIHKMSDPKPACTECGGKVKRLVSQSSFILKGDGWTVNEKI